MPEWSSYAYAFNNPVKFVDPTGMMPESPDDWIYNKKTDSYFYDENITKASDLNGSKNLEYVGETKADIKTHYDKNNNRLLRAFNNMFNTMDIDDSNFKKYVENSIVKNFEYALNKASSNHAVNLFEGIKGVEDYFEDLYIKSTHSININFNYRGLNGNGRLDLGFFGKNTDRYNFDKNMCITNVSLGVDTYKGEINKRTRLPLEINMYTNSYQRPAATLNMSIENLKLWNKIGENRKTY